MTPYIYSAAIRASQTGEPIIRPMVYHNINDPATYNINDQLYLGDSIIMAPVIRNGVTEDRIFCDYAGFRTLDSVVRAKEIFGQTNITIISQEFHNQRAIYIARRKGIDAIGFNAKEATRRNSFKTLMREQLARVKTVLDMAIGVRPKFYGERVPIPVGGDVKPECS